MRDSATGDAGGSGSSLDGHSRTLQPPRTIWIVATYIFLAVVTGAVSFGSRKYPVAYAADYQQRAWTAFLSRGRVFPGDSNDLNLVHYTKRPLMPLVAGAVVQATGLPWPLVFAFLRLVLITGCYIVFHLYLRSWFPSSVAMIGTLFMAATVPLTFKDWLEIPTDFPEILLTTLALWSMHSGRGLSYLPMVTLVASLNRPTGIYIPLLLVVTCVDRRDLRAKMIPILSCFFAWVGVTVFIEWWTQFMPVHSVVNNARGALSHALAGLTRRVHPYNNFLFYAYLFGAFWLLPIVHRQALPIQIKRMLLIVPLHVMMAFFFGGGRIDEPRHLCVLYPILVPASLFALFSGPAHLGRDGPGNRKGQEAVRAGTDLFP